jgi:hypothetical protein
MSNAIRQFVHDEGIAAVSLDGPQGWRLPNVENRRGVGRWCEFQARTQGKTGEFGRTYPGTQQPWIRFCIDVFSALLEDDNVLIVNDPSCGIVKTLSCGFWLIECFPTSTWRTSGLKALPGKSRMRRQAVDPWWQMLRDSYQLPKGTGWTGTHDDLQALVAALPAAALLGGPCVAVPRGLAGAITPSTQTTPAHWTEGIIWDCSPNEAYNHQVGAEVSSEVSQIDTDDTANPILIDERDEVAEALLARGTALFRWLVKRANAGDSVGIGYSQFACIVHGVTSFRDIAGRNYTPSDTRHVVHLAHQVTDAANGRQEIRKNGAVLNVGIDTFIWPQEQPHVRPEQAFATEDYSFREWLIAFPDGSRRLLDTSEAANIQAAIVPS